MDVKTDKPIRLIFIYGFIVTIILSTVLTASSGSEDKEKEQLHLPSIIISNQLRFAPSGEPGEFREIEPVIIKVHQSVRCIQFSATPFLYNEDAIKGKFGLNATYWVDNPQQCFDSKKPLLLYTGASKISGSYNYSEMRLYGKVTIDQISDQPAGEYEGNIMVTVTERL